MPRRHQYATRSPPCLITYPIPGSYLYTIQAADFNLDQWPDLVLHNHCEIEVLLNDQHGGFTTSWTTVDGYRYCGLTLAVADMNGDQAPDSVAGEQSGPEHLYLPILLRN